MSTGPADSAAAVLDRTSASASAPAAGSAPGASPIGTGRVRHIDALRVLSCFSVISVHALGAPYPIDDVGLGQVSYLLHYSREIFFFVSALVLVRTYYPRLGPDGRLPDEAGFRRRRMRLIGVPYLWWTSIYFAVSIYHTRGAQPAGVVLDDMPLRWLYLVVTGNGSYHMYFLLVTLQFGVAFPLVLRLLRRTRGHHGKVLAASAVLQVATLAAYHWWFLPDDGWRGLLGDASLLAYQLWLVGGAIVGLHLERWHAWVVRYKAVVLAALPLTAVVLMWTFWAQLPSRGALGASSPLQPMMVLWSVAALGVLYLAGVWIMERGSANLQAMFSYGAQLSFGVYLAHPLVLDLVLSVSRRLGVMAPSPWMSVAALFFTTTLTVAGCTVLHRTRLSLPLMGRAQLTAAQAPRIRLPRPKVRAAAGPLVLLVIALSGLLLVGGDQSPADLSYADATVVAEEQIVQASEPAPLELDSDPYAAAPTPPGH